MKDILILTVGTGTAGKHSDLASGLEATIRLVSPRKLFLVPSTSPDSLAIADLLAGSTPASYAESFPLPAPDDLEACRLHIRSVIARIRPQLKDGERLLVNPTSGTKQMTAAATLAALDEQPGHIIFTTGERADGVVVTGTEHITEFDATSCFRERDLALAREFFDAADFYAAERILRPHKATLTREWNIAHTCHHWRRFDYDSAKSYGHAFGISSANRAPRDIIADHLAWSAHALRHNAPDASHRLTYKALELAARLFLEEETGLKPDGEGRYSATAVSALRTSFIPDGKKTKLTLGLHNIVQILHERQHPFGAGYDHRLHKLSDIRNKATHDIRPVSPKEAESYYKLALGLVAIPPTTLPASLDGNR